MQNNIVMRGYGQINNIVMRGYFDPKLLPDLTGDTNCNFYKEKIKENFYHKDSCKKRGCSEY